MLRPHSGRVVVLPAGVRRAQLAALEVLRRYLRRVRRGDVSRYLQLFPEAPRRVVPHLAEPEQ
ncbi:hypothetical protein ACFCXS_15195 [Streptomyces sp. NPDC056373]|uniref:hypothetical protein n=1 Tax=Streptomyces sp. NPDC056373 TaxID=3345798 RepID=UPI0035D5FC0C